MSKKPIIKRRRKIGSRKRKSIILIAAEGKNETEKNYFKHFRNDKFVIEFTKGNDTDPENMYR